VSAFSEKVSYVGTISFWKVGGRSTGKELLRNGNIKRPSASRQHGLCPVRKHRSPIPEPFDLVNRDSVGWSPSSPFCPSPIPHSSSDFSGSPFLLAPLFPHGPAIEASPRQAAGNVLPDGRASQHRKDDNFLDIRSPTPQQATGNALAYAVQGSVIPAGLSERREGARYILSQFSLAPVILDKIQPMC
jgi:hypothetical protein